MPLTPEDIDRLIAGNAHEDIIRHSLSNYFEDLNEPVAVAIGIAPPTIVSDGERKDCGKVPPDKDRGSDPAGLPDADGKRR